MNLCVKYDDSEYVIKQMIDGNDYNVDYFTLKNMVEDRISWGEFEFIIRNNRGWMRTNSWLNTLIVFNTEEEAQKVIDILDPYLMMRELIK